MRNQRPNRNNSPFQTRYALWLFGLLFVMAGWILRGLTIQTPQAVTTQPAPVPPPPLPPSTTRIHAERLAIRAKPSHQAQLTGWIGANEPFEVLSQVEGPQCGAPGWAKTEGGGFVCLFGSRETEEASLRLPRLVRFVHPDPTEWDRYLKTLSYDTNPPDKIDAMVPFIYAKRWRKWQGKNYASAAAFARDDAPIKRLGVGRKYHFVDTAPTQRGTVLIREDGVVVPADQVHIYPLSKFHGLEMDNATIPRGQLAAWAIDYEGTPVHTAPSHSSTVGNSLPYHTAFSVDETPVDQAGHWWVIPDGLGPGRAGYVNDETGIRHWVPAPPVEGLIKGALWIDVDLNQQVLALRRGSQIEFVTLISSGTPGHGTPKGIYSIQDKSIWSDMASRPASDDPYFVEKVPWVMHFKQRYALHGTFWHWGFGHPASHGCINLSVRDARWVFDRISPTAHGGWHSAFSSPKNPGTVLRVRRGQARVPDRREQ